MRSALLVLAASALLLVLGQAQSIPRFTESTRDLALAVYGTASFESGFCVGSHAHKAEPGSAGVVLAGDSAELSLHDRQEGQYSEAARWAFYASRGKMRVFRQGNQGGLALSAASTTIFKDLNVGGKVSSEELTLSGSGNASPSAAGGEAVLIGDSSAKHLKFGYDAGSSWIQSGNGHLSLNPLKNQLCVGTMIPKKQFTVGGGHLRVKDSLYVGAASISETQFQLGHGGGWKSEGAAVSSTSDAPVKTNGQAEIWGRVGIGIKPEFPTFKLQVHGGSVMVAKDGNQGLSIQQLKDGALLRSWNADSKQHEAMMIQGAPLILQPGDGPVLIGTTVPKKNMKMHVHGNLYIHGDMHSMSNLHVRDHAVLRHLVMPSLTLKGSPQQPDGDTLVLGHMSQSASRQISAKEKTVLSGVNLRFGYHAEYTWIQVHGKSGGDYKPLALNPMGNVVSIGSVSPDKKVNLHAKGNGYVLGKLYVKNPVTEGAKPSDEDAAVAALRQAVVHVVKSATDKSGGSKETSVVKSTKSAGSVQDWRDSTLALLSVPESMHSSTGHKHAPTHQLTKMFAGVLNRQDTQLKKQAAILKVQAAQILKLRQHLGM